MAIFSKTLVFKNVHGAQCKACVLNTLNCFSSNGRVNSLVIFFGVISLVFFSYLT